VVDSAVRLFAVFFGRLDAKAQRQALGFLRAAKVCILSNSLLSYPVSAVGLSIRVPSIVLRGTSSLCFVALQDDRGRRPAVRRNLLTAVLATAKARVFVRFGKNRQLSSVVVVNMNLLF
jgi:hypothetical protein